MSFNINEVAELLAQSHRRCCICHKFCGVKMELHHIQHKSERGSDDIINAIPLCFECHAEVNHYNDRHPRGRKFTEEELLLHKKQWLNICQKNPAELINAPRDSDVGPLEGMLLELEYNQTIVNRLNDGFPWQEKIGSSLRDDQYMKAIETGSLLLLPDTLRKLVNNAYSSVSRVNTFTSMYANTRPEGNAFAEATNRLLQAYRNSQTDISKAFSELSNFLIKKGGEENE